MKALIVDGEELFRLSLKEVVMVSGNFQHVMEVSTEHEFLSKTANHDDLSLIVVHPASLGDEGADCMRLIRRLYPDAAVVTILDHEGQHYAELPGSISIARRATVSQMVTAIRRALKLPLDGFGAVSRSPSAPDVRTAMSQQFSQASAQSQSRPSVAASVDLARLSYRQKQILAMAADGLPNKEIAARLDIAEGTVKAHMHAIFKVLGVSNRTQAVIRYSGVGQPASPQGNGATVNTPSWAYAAAS
ncbi:MAG: response regulator transcription factor [Alphaproteobacteria bacterium]|nr:response regulator transcription factor [Alphaproteobacteria bacterium]